MFVLHAGKQESLWSGMLMRQEIHFFIYSEKQSENESYFPLKVMLGKSQLIQFWSTMKVWQTKIIQVQGYTAAGGLKSSVFV